MVPKACSKPRITSTGIAAPPTRTSRNDPVSGALGAVQHRGEHGGHALKNSDPVSLR
ncbi:hypothetical protein I551_8294 [Mycobacterium ulcerans str. Harvey]|uniref:Uncharacterized protein n=1 Tax=Mycobacterium ulcerans str. Harvey TaxID=1299332 RepID=A0ABN0QKU5_MYCUL|nr:hypothetical protein I551_8294 [Mycobacterium ulcerans str. Harvey]